jgi:hypothetical protein
VFDAFVTVAVNGCVPLVNKVALVGEMLTPTGCGAVIVIVDIALLLGSWTLVAVTENDPAVVPAV